eukprot:GCRY01005281.1.p1 GENE.GCRY01005281.1~~GCRY01005281.1.p1  ORF type:complete len:214 (+),score=19.68 GCRY01005281.1:212-853(+)
MAQSYLGIFLFFAFCLPFCTFAVSFAPVMNIDLQKDVEFRFQDSVFFVLDTHGWENSFLPVFERYNETLFNLLPNGTFDRLANAVATSFPQHAAELRGISHAFWKKGHYVSFEYLCGWVYYHELGHCQYDHELSLAANANCAAILASDYKGRVVHGRNMDQLPPAIRNVTLHHIYRKAGAIAYESVDWYWFTTGFMTGFKAYSLSLQENWRFK